MDNQKIARELLGVAREITGMHGLDKPYEMANEIDKMIDGLLKHLKRAKGTSDYIDEGLLAEMIDEAEKAAEKIQDVSAGAQEISSNIESRRWNFKTRDYGPEWGSKR